MSKANCIHHYRKAKAHMTHGPTVTYRVYSHQEIVTIITIFTATITTTFTITIIITTFAATITIITTGSPTF